MIQKLFTGIFILLIISMLLVACKQQPIKQLDEITRPKKIKIGVIVPTSGMNASHGQEGLKGLELALSEFNNSDFSIEYIVEDTHSNSTDAVTATRKLINFDKVKIIAGVLNSSDTLAVAPICEKQGVIYLAIGASTPKLSSFGKYIFRHAPLASAQAEKAADYMFKKFNDKNICIFYINNSTGKGYYNAFIESTDKLGLMISLTEKYETNITNMKTELTKLKNADCEILYTPSVPKSMGYIIKQNKELNYSPQIIANFGAEGQEVIDIAGQEADGIIYTSVGIDKSFIDKYRLQYKKKPQMVSALAYDSINILLQAVYNVGDDADLVKKYLSEMPAYQGSTGAIYFNELNDAVKEIILKTVRQGEFVLFEEK